jgi:hypothetical protein
MHNMPKQKPIALQSSSLSTQQIDSSGPGTILADFETLLDFIGTGVRSTGQYHLLPMDRLRELDERMAHPLHPNLERPQQKSFPHINGLYLLLRATRMGVSMGQGKSSGRLLIDPLMLEQWRGLNPTEQYFNLLEAWMRHATWPMVGLRNSGWGSQVALNARDLCAAIPPEGRKFQELKQRRGDFLYSMERACSLALLELFGLMTVERGEPQEGEGWCVTRVLHTPFGDELLDVIFQQIQLGLLSRNEPKADFGAWQRILQPSFPAWKKNLKFNEPEFRDGIYYFRVSLGRPWRRIAITGQSDLADLADCIIQAYDFDGDHLYAFDLVGRDGQKLSIDSPECRDGDAFADETAIGSLPLDEKQSMLFHYDFGASWRFKVVLEKIVPGDTEIAVPEIVESKGEAPPEYGSDDEW